MGFSIGQSEVKGAKQDGELVNHNQNRYISSMILKIINKFSQDKERLRRVSA